MGEEFARKLLDQAVPTYDALPEAKELAALVDHAVFLEKALFVAGHFGRMEHVHPLVRASSGCCSRRRARRR